MKRYFEVVNSGTPNVGKISIYGNISGWDEDINARDFLAAFNALEVTCSRINIHINSPGGSVWEGLPIVNAIKASAVDVHTYVDGIAFSMAGIIAISAKPGNVHMAKGSLLMLHSASMYGYGNSEKLKKVAEDLSKYDDVLAGYVEDRTGLSIDEVKANYFDGVDHFFTPSEALAESLIDHIETYAADDTPSDAQNLSYGEVAAWYDKVKNSDKNIMFNKFNKLSDLAKVAVNDRTSEHLEAVNLQIQSGGVEGVTLVTDSFLTDQETQLETLKMEKTNLEIDNTAKGVKIQGLEAEVLALGKIPGAAPGTPKSDGDKTPSGDGTVVDTFNTTVDDWAKRVLGKG